MRSGAARQKTATVRKRDFAFDFGMPAWRGVAVSVGTSVGVMPKEAMRNRDNKRASFSRAGRLDVMRGQLLS